MPGEEHDRHIGVDARRDLCQLDPRHAWHGLVRQEKFETLRAEQLQRLFP